MVGLFYKAVPVLADEDKIGGSAIVTSLHSQPKERVAKCSGSENDVFHLKKAVLYMLVPFPENQGTFEQAGSRVGLLCLQDVTVPAARVARGRG